MPPPITAQPPDVSVAIHPPTSQSPEGEPYLSRRRGKIETVEEGHDKSHVDDLRRNPFGESASNPSQSHSHTNSHSLASPPLHRGGHAYFISPSEFKFDGSNSITASYRAYRYGARSISRKTRSSDVWRSSSEVLPDTRKRKAAKRTALQSILRLRETLKPLLSLVLSDKKHRDQFQRNLLHFILFIFLIFLSPSILEPITKSKPWDWSPKRKLNNRKCVMNLFIEKQPPDEFNPDFKDMSKDPRCKTKSGKPKKRCNLPQPAAPIAEGTYRTKGQLHVVDRFIEAVADSFRSNTTIHQHIIFTGTRDGGHLAEKALKHWPPRGNKLTKLHVIAADADHDGEDALEYMHLADIEERFEGKEKQVKVYDRLGLAGSRHVEKDDDEADDDSEEYEENNLKRAPLFVYNGTVANREVPYFDLSSLLPTDEDRQIVPYMHIDGTRMEDQLEILHATKPLMEDNIVVMIGIEHSPDTDVYTLLEFFASVNYKLFFLGSRQVARIDNLCTEILDDIIRHPSITPQKPTTLQRVLQKLGIISIPDVSAIEAEEMMKYPPFFVAMPRGRTSKEEMTIQHMYDLFGGYGGGGGQIKTANDRKAPGKK